jgi:hypothetical protein
MADIRIYEDPEKFEKFGVEEEKFGVEEEYGYEDEYGYEEEYGVDFGVEQFLEELEFDPDSLSMASYITLPPDPKFRKSSKNQIFTLENLNASTVQAKGFLAAHYHVIGGSSDAVKLYVGGEPFDHSAVIRELELNPVLVSGIQISGEPATLQKFALGISTKTLWGASSTNVAVASAYRSPKDFDRSLIELPISFILNGRTGLDFTIPANESISFIVFVSSTQPNDALLRKKITSEPKTIRAGIPTGKPKGGARVPGGPARPGIIRPGVRFRRPRFGRGR